MREYNPIKHPEKVYREGKRILAQIYGRHVEDIGGLEFINLSLKYLFNKSSKDKKCKKDFNHLLNIINLASKERLVKRYLKGDEQIEIYEDLALLSNRPAFYGVVYREIILNNLSKLETDVAKIDKIQEKENEDFFD